MTDEITFTADYAPGDEPPPWPWSIVLEPDMTAVRSFTAVRDDVRWNVGEEIYIDCIPAGYPRKYRVTAATLLPSGVLRFDVKPISEA